MMISSENDQLERPTPVYFYDLKLLEDTLKSIVTATQYKQQIVHYAFKANANKPILNLIHKYGLGADCVSGNEIKLALDSGFPPSSIVFAGVGKTDDEICYALENQIFCFNCESIQEIEVINTHANRMNKKAHIAIRINPNIDAHTHAFITTGVNENKFGIGVQQLEAVLQLIRKSESIVIEGIHFHIGSQITKMYVFRELCAKINQVNAWFVDQGIRLNHINVGGGLGIDYDAPDDNPIPDFHHYFNLFDQFIVRDEKQQLHFELGRSIVGQCGSLLSKVLYLKEGISTNFVICDAGMTELIRPALYQAKHQIDNISSCVSKTGRYDVVGPVCESSDCFGRGVELPLTKRGDIVAIRSAGAYGEVMASGYNLRRKVESIYSQEPVRSVIQNFSLN
ncbi:MAG: diaminopimelate decarboxylase [Crocinitomicaceae bacterium]|jgi:diaminopimelate decarboxylase|nr:diaminopimelate decarboxylase [Crocinitomicaceae bacterium]MBT5402951.1 diaminopimelate decarboxylase [Crocinitomicaceae bacterium]MBT6030070.1 diaminopimelate decarboxylase [Crocinitomicaceae bacterium]MBT6514779.1 diaminopimelate decarboxylase [Crocinitomicaceae bacterium]